MEVEVIEKLSESLSNKVVVTEEELKVKAIRSALKVLGLKAVNFSENDLKEVVCSFLDCPITLKSLHFSEKVEINGIKFYHLHTVAPSKEDFIQAYEEYIRATNFLSKLDAMIASVDKFFEGYDREGHFLRIYSDKNRYAVFFSTIRYTFEDAYTHLNISTSFDGEYVVAVKVEDKPDEFIKFFKTHSENFKIAKVRVWVVNPEKLTVDPFIGYPRDLKLISRFKNPKFATRINSLWRLRVEEID